MKILMLNYEFPPLGGGGGVFSSDLAKELAKHHTVDIITSGYKGLPVSEVIDNIRIFRVPIFMRTNLSTASFISMLSYCIFGIIKGIGLCFAIKYDLISTHFAIPTGPAGFVLSKLFHKPNVLSIYGGDIYDPTKKLSPHRIPALRLVIRIILRSANKVVAESTDIKKKAEDYYSAGDINLIPLGFSLPSYKKVSRSELGYSETSTLIIAIGRLIKRKGYDLLIKALSRIKDPNVKLLIIGIGPEKAYLEKVCSESGVDKQVLFLGQVSEEKKFQHLSVSTIFALSSLHEGFGIVFLEAMYCGLPVITTDCGGQADFLKDGTTGFLTPVGDEGLLTEKISLLIKDKGLRSQISDHNKEYAKSFSIQKTAEQYEALFNQVRNEVKNGH